MTTHLSATYWKEACEVAESRVAELEKTLVILRSMVNQLSAIPGPTQGPFSTLQAALKEAEK